MKAALGVRRLEERFEWIAVLHEHADQLEHDRDLARPIRLHRLAALDRRTVPSRSMSRTRCLVMSLDLSAIRS